MASRPHSASLYDNDDFDDITDMHRNGHDSVDVFADEFAEDYADSIHTLTAENPFLDTATPSEGGFDGGFQETSQHGDYHHANARDSIKKSGADGPVSHFANRDFHERDGHRLGNDTDFSGLASSSRSDRTLSLTSSASFAPSRTSTIRAPNSSSGPSHAYGMFPQGLGVDRPASIASTSTGWPSHVSGRRGPLHQYGLYPQNATDSIGASSIAPSYRTRSVTSGRRQGLSYQDSIRSSAPSEQLPAYTRFPDELHSKIAAGPPLTPTSRRSIASQMEERSPFETYAYELTADESTAVLNRGNAPQSREYSEKQDASKNRTAWLKGRICGCVPIWTIAVIMVAVIIAVCGGVIGAYIGHERHLTHLSKLNSTASTTSGNAMPDHTTLSLIVTETTTEYVDATPIATPASFTALPTGIFQVNIDVPATLSNSSACINDPAQRIAWSCDMETTTTLDLQIAQTNQGAFLTVNNYGMQFELSYGTQPPALVGQLVLVNLLGNTSLGPAFHFQTDHNKLVILPGNTPLAQNSGSQKRDVFEEFEQPALWARQIIANDNPWFCWFNHTSIEGFVFVNHTAIPPPPYSATATSTQATSSYITSSPAAYLAASATTTVSATLSSETLSVLTADWPAHPQYYNYPTAWPTQWLKTWSEYSQPPPPPPPPTTSCAPATPSSRNGDGQWMQPHAVRRAQHSTSSTIPGFPMLFRLEERRDQHAAPAACTRMAKVNPWVYAPVISNGAQVVVYLNETDPQYDSAKPVYKRGSSRQCSCLWQT